MAAVSERALSTFLLGVGAALGLNGRVKYSDDQPRDESGQWTSGGGGSAPSDVAEGGAGGDAAGTAASGDPFTAPAVGARVGTLTVIADHAFKGEPQDIRNAPSKQAVGALGERIALEWLRGRGLTDAKPMNMERANFPVDLIQDHEAIEVKAGLVSNSERAQQWRLTIGQPGPTETAWLARASDRAKERWNQQKVQAIATRKKTVLRQLSKDLGVKVKGRTMAFIVNPDTKTADLFVFEGFHARIGWKSEQARAGYVATVRYE